MNPSLIYTLNKLAAKYKRLAEAYPSNNINKQYYAKYTNASKFGLAELDRHLMIELEQAIRYAKEESEEAFNAVHSYL